MEAAEEVLQILTECATVNTLDLYITAAAGARGELDPVGEALGGEESLSRLRAARYEFLTTPLWIARTGPVVEMRFFLRDSSARAPESVGQSWTC